jgi:endoribonuclease Dicer
MRNAQLALNSKKKGKYPMMLKPTLWERDRGTIPTQVYLTVINIEGSLDRPHQPLGILTRHPLPDFATFPMFLEKGNVPIVVIESLREAMPIEADMIEKATDYNLLLLRDVFNKTYERAPAMMSYWIVPVHSEIHAPETPFKRIDWETLNLCATQDEYEWDPERSHEDYEDKFLVDRWTGARRWFTKGVDPTKKPLDPVPEEAVKHKFMENILEYSITLFKTSRSGVAWKWKTDQVVIEADQMQFRRNILAKPEKKEKKLRYKAWLIPQPLKLSTVSTKLQIQSQVSNSDQDFQ